MHVLRCYASQVVSYRYLHTLCTTLQAFTGKLSAEFADLMCLEVLSLEQNRLKGHLPAEYGRLRNLREIRLHENQIGGKLPVLEWQRLSNLEELELFPNRLECTQRAVDNLLASVGREVTRDIDINPKSVRTDASSF